MVGSATLVAVMVTVAGLGMAAGAVKSPVVEIVPTVAFPPIVPFTAQVTAGLFVFVREAVNCCVCETATLAVAGLTDIVTALCETTPEHPAATMHKDMVMQSKNN